MSLRTEQWKKKYIYVIYRRHLKLITFHTVEISVTILRVFDYYLL